VIVSTVLGLSTTAGDIGWRCLARRGMLHCECEAIDYMRLGLGAVRDGRGRSGVEEAWFVLDGHGHFRDDADRWIPVRPGDLVLWAGGPGGWLRSDTESSLELLGLAVLPAAVSRQLPVRSPRTPRTGGPHG
jgi:hypothetical protein